MKIRWWKILCVLLLLYTIVAGFLMPVPSLAILHESIRNLYFHVPMWFAMIIIFGVSVVYSIKFLSNQNQGCDIVATESANVGIVFGLLGIVTGMIWAKFTWGDWWSNDPKQNGAAVALLIYFAYFVLRNSMDDIDRRAKVAAVYNIFAFSTLIPLLFILPRMTDSLHPGSGGNPGFDVYDLDANMRWVFYPSIIGWTLLGIWIISIRFRLRNLENYFRTL